MEYLTFYENYCCIQVVNQEGYLKIDSPCQPLDFFCPKNIFKKDCIHSEINQAYLSIFRFDGKFNLKQCNAILNAISCDLKWPFTQKDCLKDVNLKTLFTTDLPNIFVI